MPENERKEAERIEGPWRVEVWSHVLEKGEGVTDADVYFKVFMIGEAHYSGNDRLALNKLMVWATALAWEL